MSEPGEPQPSSRTRTIPPWASALSIVVAVLAMTALVWVLFKGTAGPGESVRGFYDAVGSGDCDAAWEALAPSARGDADQASFCAKASDAAATVPGGVHVQQVTLLGEEGEASRARVTMEEGDVSAVWSVERNGDRWYVTALPSEGIFSGF